VVVGLCTNESEFGKCFGGGELEILFGRVSAKHRRFGVFYDTGKRQDDFKLGIELLDMHDVIMRLGA
jgi:hypothetical protein